MQKRKPHYRYSWSFHDWTCREPRQWREARRYPYVLK